MSAQHPGFGVTPSWGGNFAAAGILLLFTIGTVHTGHGGWAIALAVLTLACFGMGMSIRMEYARESAALRHNPPTPQAELTRRVCSWTHASPQDLDLNRQGILSPTQWEYIRTMPDHWRFPPKHISVVQYVQGPVDLICYNQHRSSSYHSYGVNVQGIVFTDQNCGLVDAFKRTGIYRLYFVELVYTRWGASRRLLLLSGEALGDA